MILIFNKNIILNKTLNEINNYLKTELDSLTVATLKQEPGKIEVQKHTLNRFVSVRDRIRGSDSRFKATSE